ncbi:hypothetical protein K8R30_04465 [archaeon]|nr:hypothetical protein [archaeon]
MVKIELGKWDSVWIVVLISLVGFGFVYGYGGSEPVAMGHSAGELEGVCLSDGTNCAEAAGSSYTVCSWYDGKACPVEDGTPLLLTAYSSTQVKCCGVAAVACTAYGWTTYNTYCSASCGGQECGGAAGVWRYDQRRRFADCEIEYQTISGAACSTSCGSCPYGEYCSSGSCIISPR